MQQVVKCAGRSYLKIAAAICPAVYNCGALLNTELRNRITAEIPAWQTRDNTIERSFSTTGWKSSLMIANTVGYMAEAAWHHPELVVGYDKVTVILTTHSEGGVTEKDLALAKKIDELAVWPSQSNTFESPPQRFAMIKPEN